MTSGYMDCPKCGESFRYMGYEKRGIFLELIDIPEPWKCSKGDMGLKSLKHKAI